MGGLGPSYEQVIQIGVFECLKEILDNNLNDNITPEEFNVKINPKLAIISEKIGMSGAQAGAIKQLLWGYFKEGYHQTIERFKEKELERVIQVMKRFPSWEEKE